MSLLCSLDTGVVEHTADDQRAAQNLQSFGDLVEQKDCQNGCHDRFAQLGCGHKGRGEELQAPAEDAVAQNGGEDGKQCAYHNGTETVVEKSVTLYQTGSNQNGGTSNELTDAVK